MKRLLKCCVAVLLMPMITSSVMAEYDLDGHWAREAIDEMIDKGYISGYSDGSIKPDNFITRAEFMSAANKIFNFTQKRSISFKDVKKSDWFYDTVETAAEAGYISGYEDNTIRAENYITKQEAAFIVNKIMGYNGESSYADKFSDGADIDSWVKGAVGALAKNGIINGYSDGSFKAKNNITRAEAFTILNKAQSLKRLNESDKYIGYARPNEVSNFEQWKKAIMYSIDNLNESLELKIIGFDNNTYDLEKLGIVTVGIKAEGSLKNGTATVKYSFDYSENFKMLRAVEDGSLSSKLDKNQKEAVDTLQSIKNEIIKPDMSDYEKELAIHDYIVLNYEYDNSEENKGKYNVKDFLKTKKGACEAYAYSFAIIGKLAGLDCAVIYGSHDGVNHAWNAVKLDGEYYYTDPTFDDGAESAQTVIYNYFNLNDDSLSKTHIWDKDKNNNIKADGVKYNYFIYNGCEFDNIENLKNYIINCISQNKKTIYFCCKNFTINEKSIRDILFDMRSDVSGYNLIGSTNEEGAFTVIVEYR